MQKILLSFLSLNLCLVKLEVLVSYLPTLKPPGVWEVKEGLQEMELEWQIRVFSIIAMVHPEYNQVREVVELHSSDLEQTQEVQEPMVE